MLKLPVEVATIAEALLSQPLSSVIVTVYVPPTSPVILFVFAALDQR